MKRLARILVIPIFFLSVVSCSKDNNNGTPSTTYTTFKATLTGANERPDPTTSTATGAATLTYNNTTKTFVMTLTYDGITPNAGHIHKGGPDEAGPVIFPLTITASPINYTSPVLTVQQEADLMNNLYYTNLHTTAYPNGEIRGQLIKQTTPGGGGY